MSLIEVRVADLLPSEVSEPSREQPEAAREEARSKIKAAQVEVRNGAGVALLGVPLLLSSGLSHQELLAESLTDRFSSSSRVMVIQPWHTGNV